MKKQILSLISLVMLGLVAAFAQVPSSPLTYQLVVRNFQNQVVVNQSGITVDVTVWDADGTTQQYTETHTGLSTNANGLLTLPMGSSADHTGTWADIDWADASIQTVVRYESVEITSERIPVTAVPYTLDAGNVPDENGFVSKAGNNTLTGTNTVPAGFDINTTNSTNCNNIVVNTCDLYTVFDSLNRRLNHGYDSLQWLSNEILAARNSAPPMASPLTFENVTYDAMTIIAHFSSITPITQYRYWISRNEDMSHSVCAVSTESSLTVDTLTPGVTYYVKVNATNTADIASSSASQTMPMPTLTLTADNDGSVDFCDGYSVDVTYTATPNYGNSGDYTYSWSGSPVSTSGNTATYTYSSGGNKTVTVTATHTAPDFTLTATGNTDVNSIVLSIGFCENDGIVSVKSVSGDPNYISWGDGETGTSVSTSTTHDYTSLGIGSHSVTITASNDYGCTFSRTMTVPVYGTGSTAADHTVNPCAVGSHAAQTGSAYRGNGYGGANHGLETVNGEGKITSVTDYDGNAYPVVQVGSHCWLAENLRCSHSPKTGSNIVVTAVQNHGSKMAAWYDNDRSTYESKRYGLLYNWCAALDTAKPSSGDYTYVEVATAANSDNRFNFNPPSKYQGICPTGWHVPTLAEWEDVVYSVGGSALSTGCDWTNSGKAGAPGSYTNAARNSSGFSVVPSGYFYAGSTTFNRVNEITFFWTVSANWTNNWYIRLVYDNESADTNLSYVRPNAYSVRCVRN